MYTTKALSVDMFTVEDVTYSGVALKPVVVGKDGDKNLVVDNDFTVTYTNNIQVGTASATITGIGGYSGIVSITFTIIPNEVKVTGLLLKTKVYDGNTIMEVDTSSLKLEGISEKDADKVSIGGLPDIVEVENKNAGEKTAIIKVADLKLVQEDSNYVLSSEDITVVGTISKKKVVLMDMEFKSKYYDGSKYMTLTTQEGTIKSGVLEGDEVTFNTKSDRYVISGTANAGSKKRKLTKGLWKISGKDANNYTLSSSPIAKGKIYKIEVKKVTLKKNSVKYDGMGHKPIISQIFGSGGIKILQKNCKIEYLRNGKKTNDFKSKGTITVKVTGKTPNWKGSVSVNFKIK